MPPDVMLDRNPLAVRDQLRIGAVGWRTEFKLTVFVLAQEILFYSMDIGSASN